MLNQTVKLHSSCPIWHQEQSFSLSLNLNTGCFLLHITVMYGVDLEAIYNTISTYKSTLCTLEYAHGRCQDRSA